MIARAVVVLLYLAMAPGVFAQAKAKPANDDVLKGLASAVTLPELTVDGQPNPKALQPLSLGKADVPTGSTVLVALQGGDSAAKSRTQSFQLETVGDELTARAWDIWLKTGKGTERLKVATVSLKDSALRLQWASDAVGQPAAPLLCNCVLQVLAGKSEKLIALRQPATGEAFKLSWSEPTVERWDLVRAPEASRLKVELSLKGIGRFKLNGNSTLKADGDETWIEFTDKGVAGIVRIRLECDTKRQLELKATPMLALPGEKPARLDEAALKKSEANLQAKVNQLDQQSQALAKGGKPVAAAKAQVDRQLGDLKKSLAGIQAARRFVEEAPKSVAIPVRVFFEVDKKLIDVLKTGK